MDLPKTLVVTNDFPPRLGGVQQYVFNLVRSLPPERVAVLAPAEPGADSFDRTLPFEVLRAGTRTLLPTPRLARRVRDLVRSSGAEVVLFGHALPLALLGPGLAAAGTPYVVCTHGVEYWTALVPGPAAGLRRATGRAAHVFAISRFTARAIRAVVPRRVTMSLLPPGVDVERFRPGLSGTEVRARHGFSDRRLIVCVSRLVPRKGQDVLIEALPRLRGPIGDAGLLIVGDGPYRSRMEAAAARLPAGTVAFAGAVEDAELPAYHSASDVFAMPCRSRFGGLEVEGLGIVFLEAAACGKAAVAGDSGGAPDAVLHEATGLVVDGRRTGPVADALAGLLSDPQRAAAMGNAARSRAERRFAWPRLARLAAARLREAAG